MEMVWLTACTKLAEFRVRGDWCSIRHIDFDTRTLVLEFAHLIQNRMEKTLIMTFTQFISNFHREESGQDMLEYALVMAAVLVAVVAGSTTLSTTIKTELTAISTAISAITIP